MTEQSNK